MAIVIGIHFTGNSKLYYFDPSEVWPAVGDGVICDTSRGPEYGVVATSAREIDDSLLQSPLRKVTALATEDDMKRVKSNRELSRHALKVCKEKILLHKLDMKLIDVEVAFDMSKIVFFFTANERVDFRELVKDLASQFKTRIEMRQIGVRDEARILGGLGPCGRDICCRSYLNAFQPVSIKMAKEQNLALNPTKISGLCGRLMCCLKYEEDYYESTSKRMPKIGHDVMTPDGLGNVMSNDVLRERVRVRLQLPDGSFDVRTYAAADCTKATSADIAALNAARAAYAQEHPPRRRKDEEAPAAEEPAKKERRSRPPRGKAAVEDADTEEATDVVETASEDTPVAYEPAAEDVLSEEALTGTAEAEEEETSEAAEEMEGEEASEDTEDTDEEETSEAAEDADEDETSEVAKEDVEEEETSEAAENADEEAETSEETDTPEQPE